MLIHATVAQIPCCDVITYKEYGNEQWMDNDKDMRKYNVNTGLLRSIIRERERMWLKFRWRESMNTQELIGTTTAQDSTGMKKEVLFHGIKVSLIIICN